jgi:hypothetical protein
MLDGVPHIVIPAMLYNLVLCSLFAALGWQLVATFKLLRRRRDP